MCWRAFLRGYDKFFSFQNFQRISSFCPDYICYFGKVFSLWMNPASGCNEQVSDIRAINTHGHSGGGGLAVWEDIWYRSTGLVALYWWWSKCTGSVTWSPGSLCCHLSAAITLCCSVITLVTGPRPLWHTLTRTGSVQGSWKHPWWACTLSRHDTTHHWLVEHFFGCSGSSVWHRNVYQFFFFLQICSSLPQALNIKQKGI